MNVEALIDKNKKAIEIFETTFRRLSNINSFDDLQSWDDLLLIADGTAINLTGNQNFKLHTDNQTMQFFTVIPPAGSFKKHWHDCLESCYVIHGVLGDKLNPDIMAKQGEVVYYKKGEVHTPYNPKANDYTKLLVTFFKNED